MTSLPQISKIKLRATISIYEASMIMKLREHAFGEFIIHKQNGNPYRVEIKGSEQIKPEDGFKMEDAEIFGNLHRKTN